MSVLPFLLVALGGGLLSLGARRRVGVSAVIGLGGLALAVVAADAIRPGDDIAIGGSTLAGTTWLRLFLLLGSVVGLLLALVALATTWSRDLPGATLIGLAALGVALAVADPLVGILAATGGGLVAVLLLLPPPVSPMNLLVAARTATGLAIAGAVALVAIAWTAAAAGILAVEPTATGLALLGIAAAVALRFGTIPLHGWTARIPGAAPAIALPLVMAWSPAAFASIVLGWSGSTLAPLELPLGMERAVVAGAGALSLVLGLSAALMHDDLEHVVAYSIIADAGVVLLAVAALDPAAWGPARTWLLAFVVTKSALAAWSVAIRSTFGSRHLRQLGGWARKSPPLGVALVAIAAANVGWPGLAVFDARDSILSLAVGQPLGGILVLASVAAILYYGRILSIGVRRKSPTVAAGAGPRAVWPLRHRPRPRSLAQDAPVVWRANRAPIAAALVLVLAGLSVVLGAGGLGARSAAAAPPPQPLATAAPPSASPSPAPAMTPTPTPGPLTPPSHAPTPSRASAEPSDEPGTESASPDASSADGASPSPGPATDGASPSPGGSPFSSPSAGG